MSSSFQTIAALGIVALAAGWLLARAIAKRKNPGCGGDCGAVSPEMKRLQARLKRQP
ncbi:MAG TPA: FeoB-associated Cys-rich membrane protein [Opitutaceae bacterium]|nr:FeoB-associated Cys-rich membrane protein [Opitutaceae bacterium]